MIIYRFNSFCYVLFFIIIFTMGCSLNSTQEKGSDKSTRLPSGIPPQITFWGMGNDHFEPDGYKPIIDMFADHSPFSLLLRPSRFWQVVYGVHARQDC